MFISHVESINFHKLYLARKVPSGVYVAKNNLCCKLRSLVRNTEEQIGEELDDKGMGGEDTWCKKCKFINKGADLICGAINDDIIPWRKICCIIEFDIHTFFEGRSYWSKKII